MRTLQSILGNSLDDLEKSSNKITRTIAWCESGETGPGHDLAAGLFLNPTWGKPKWTVNKNGEIDIDGDIHIYNRCDDFELPDYIQFGTVNGSVTISNCSKFKSFKGFPRIINGRLNLEQLPSITDEAIKTSPIEYCNYLFLSKINDIKRTDFVKECDILHINSCSNVKDFKKSPIINKEFYCASQQLHPMSFAGLPRKLDRIYLNHLKLPRANLKTLPSKIELFEFNYVYDKDWYTIEEFQEILPKSTKIICR